MQALFLHTGLPGLYRLLHEKRIAITALFYLIITAFILNRYGINTNGEALKYIEDAQRILNGKPLLNGFFSIFYIIYSLLIAFFLQLSFSFQGIICLQILLSFIASCGIYKIILSTTGHKNISFYALIFYLLCFPIQKWNFFLYTESLHTSLVVIGSYFLFNVFQKNQPGRWPLFFLFLLLIIFSRPVGIIFLLSSITIFFVWLIKTQTKIIYYSFLTVLILTVIMLLQSKFISYFNPDSLRRMEIICQVPQNTGINYHEYNSAGLSSFFHVITNEIGIKNFLFLGVKKVTGFFCMARTFYSAAHNTILICTAGILYPLAIAGILFFRNKKQFYIKAFSIIYILITAIGIFFTCDEWSNRFIAPVLPHIILLAAMGLYSIALILKSRLQKRNN